MYTTKTFALTGDPYSRLGEELGSMLSLKKKIDRRLEDARQRLQVVCNRLELCARNSFYRDFRVDKHAVVFVGEGLDVYPRRKVDDEVRRLKRENLDYVDPEYTVNFGGGFIVSPWDFCYDDGVTPYTDSDGVTATVAARLKEALKPLASATLAPRVKDLFYELVAEYCVAASEVYYAEGRLEDLLGDYGDRLHEALEDVFVEVDGDPAEVDVFLTVSKKGAHGFLCAPEGVRPDPSLYSAVTVIHSAKEYRRLTEAFLGQ